MRQRSCSALRLRPGSPAVRRSLSFDARHLVPDASLARASSFAAHLLFLAPHARAAAVKGRAMVPSVSRESHRITRAESCSPPGGVSPAAEAIEAAPPLQDGRPKADLRAVVSPWLAVVYGVRTEDGLFNLRNVLGKSTGYAGS